LPDDERDTGMSRRSSTVYGGHPFDPSGGTRPDRRGRIISICGECQRARNAPQHRDSAIAGPAPRMTLEERRAERVAATARHRLRVVERPLAVPTPRELVMLAYMIDEILELELGPDSWRIRLRAIALRQALPPEIPRAAGAPHIAEPDGEVSVPAPVSDEPAQRAPAPYLDAPPAEPTIMIEHRPVSERSRARALSKRIADKAARELATRAIAAGYQLRRTGGGHWILELPGSEERLTLPNRIAGYERGWKNVRAHAKRMGIDVEGI
jgi:hypothetical protein